MSVHVDSLLMHEPSRKEFGNDQALDGWCYFDNDCNIVWFYTVHANNPNVKEYIKLKKKNTVSSAFHTPNYTVSGVISSHID